MIKIFTYAGLEPGVKFLVLGAVHGTEKCGTAAIRRVIEEIESGTIRIARGQVTFVPIANPRAYEQDRRFTERNLNRFLVPVKNPSRYEDKLNNVLCPLIAAHDMLLDLHSYTIGGPAFASVDGGDAEESAFAAALGAEALVYGWQDAYAASSRAAATDPNEAVGTTAYARMTGGKGVLLECGQHQAPESVDIAYAAIRKALSYLGLVDGAAPAAARPARRLLVRQTCYRNDDGGKLAKNWTNFERVTKSEKLATRRNGEIIAAPADGFIILPNVNAGAGAEWFYFGVEE